MAPKQMMVNLGVALTWDDTVTDADGALAELSDALDEAAEAGFFDRPCVDVVFGALIGLSAPIPPTAPDTFDLDGPHALSDDPF